MNRHDRRKRSRDATPDEIFPSGHGPIQPEARDLMLRVMDALKAGFPGFDITLFIAEREAPAGQDRLPRFNYASTAAREDMIAVLEAFIIKNKAAAEKIDKINDAPPTERRQ